MNINYSYKSVPTLRRFAEDNSMIRGIMGPWGSGKSSACVMEIIQRAMQQQPFEGTRYSRWVVIRNTYPELRDTTIKTFHDWFPPKYFGHWHDTKHDYTMTELPMADGTKVHLEILFRALDRPQDVRNLLSFEFTGAWLNEAREIPKTIADGVIGRASGGRYPKMDKGGPSWYGVIMDTNPPDVDSWWFKLFEKDRPPEARIFKQPSGLGPEAENLPNLVPGYYRNLCIGKDPEWIKVYVEGKYGFVIDGQVVFPNFNEYLHVAENILTPVANLPIILGYDFGVRNPACIFGQYLPNGRLNILDECTSTNMGIRQFTQTTVKPLLMTKYPRYPVVATGDPAGTKRSDTDERTCYQEIKDQGLQVVPAWSNSIEARVNAVNEFLTRTVLGRGSLQISPDCMIIRKGFAGGYHYRRLQKSGDASFYNIPEKNIYSHPMDGLQYLAMYWDTIMKRQKRMQPTTGQPHNRPSVQEVQTAAWT